MRQIVIVARPLRIEEHRVVGQWCPRCPRQFAKALPQDLVEIAKVVNKVGASLKDPYEELLNLLASEERLNVNETGHKDNARRWWTWCIRALTYTVFKISPSRGSGVLMEVLA
jgi:hypothetical protein